jgi:competence protein ComEA
MRIFRESIERRLLRAIILVAVLVLGFLCMRFEEKSRSRPSSPLLLTTVDVQGDVRSPGAYVFSERVPTAREALASAGGLRSGRDAGLLPASAALRAQNGQSIRFVEESPGRVTFEVEPMNAGALITIGGKIDINTAGEEDLLLVPRMKPDFARAIVDRRVKKVWQRVEDLVEIPGVGEKSVEKWKEYLGVRYLPLPGP